MSETDSATCTNPKHGSVHFNSWQPCLKMSMSDHQPALPPTQHICEIRRHSKSIRDEGLSLDFQGNLEFVLVDESIALKTFLPSFELKPSTFVPATNSVRVMLPWHSTLNFEIGHWTDCSFHRNCKILQSKRLWLWDILRWPMGSVASSIRT